MTDVTDRMARRRSRMTPVLAALLLVGALTVTACGTPGSNSATPIPDATGVTAAGDDLPTVLAGRTFVSTAVTGRMLVEDTRITLTFDDDDGVRAHAGCNHLSGAASWDGRVLTVPEMGMTEMGCEGPLMDQDRWIADLLTGGVTLTLSGDELTLTGGTATLDLLDRRVADPDRSLTGTTWTLNGIISGTGDSGSASSVPQTLTVTLRMASDRLDVFNGITWRSAPLATGQDLSARSGTVRVAGSLDGRPSGARAGGDRAGGDRPGGARPSGDEVGCDGAGTDCMVDVAVLGSDFDYEITADRLTVSGVGATEGRGLMFRSVPDGFTSPDLIGSTYRLTGLFTDDGGTDTMYDDARFTITFAATGATAESSCGTISYPQVRYYGESGTMVDLGEPDGPECDLGSDPPGVPSSELMAGLDGDELYLSTGFVGWYFEPVQ